MDLACLRTRAPNGLRISRRERWNTSQKRADLVREAVVLHALVGPSFGRKCGRSLMVESTQFCEALISPANLEALRLRRVPFVGYTKEMLNHG
jgi:hypothetical protein